MKYYAVIDTNVLVSAMLKWDSIPGNIMELVFSGTIIPLLNEYIMKEYREVLSRPKFHMTEDIIQHFRNLEHETERKRTEQSFFVEKKEIVENEYNLSINKYKEVEYVPVEYPSTKEIMAEIHELEMEITKNLAELGEMLGCENVD